MAKKNCKKYPTDNRLIGAMLPLIFVPLAAAFFLPQFKHKGKVILAATIVACVVGYKTGKKIKAVDEICDGD